MIVRRQNRRFTIMAAGPRGSGKSSFFNSLIGKEIVTSRGHEGIDLYMLNLDCEGIMQRITLIDTPGFGEGFDDSEIQETICNFIKAQLDMFIAEESKIRRNPKYEDTRVHCLLYFIPSTSSSLKSRDIAFLRKVSGLVNIIPVISKSDGLSITERIEVKRQVMEQIKHYNISIFDLDDPEVYSSPAAGNDLNSLVPFLVVSADRENFESRARNYQWGDVSIDNPDHCDLPALRELLLSTHIYGLIDYTASEIYENYRAAVLEGGVRK
ncbi:SEPTIN [Encephalitozoon cuniculi GB-M1]|uniref:Cell division control protein 11 n=2 Tax=Encephalitozoon cuniculi TaxID=6035 RepID=CDC11_ENCCU|nr:septin [Encephalitozoon cuniculi GB-M1]Q8STS8.2 RecName: Full=Cell division control protein 11 [Encephalitozoon cuniculi GB-M1]KMV65445.1 septin [Encephalitozoon cuniculi EcunIII-L]UYI26767.1 septin [Encephalitozoon cuniculi]CAD27055.2 SEPTIN [Encephalitozoon cuniculi GB-M1]